MRSRAACEWQGTACKCADEGERQPCPKAISVQKGHMTGAGKRPHLTKAVRIGLDKHAPTWKKPYAVRGIYMASSLSQEDKVSSQDRLLLRRSDWGFWLEILAQSAPKA